MLDLLYIIYNVSLSLTAALFFICTYTYSDVGFIFMEIMEILGLFTVSIYYKRS